MIKFGSLDVKDIRIGEQQVKKVAVGSEVIWEKSGGVLPSGYRQVEWIRCVPVLQGSYFKGQYLMTQIQPSLDDEIEVNFKIVNNQTCQYPGIVSAVDSSTSQKATLLSLNNNALNAKFASDNYVRNSAIPLNLNTEYNVKLSRYELEINGTKYAKQSTETGLTSQNYSIFVRQINGAPLDFFTGGTYADICLKNAIIRRSGTEILNLLSCLDNNDRPCMYDLVTQQTFYNQGTGEFLYGNII